MRIVRFLDPHGQTRLGVEVEPGRADLLREDPCTSLATTGHVVDIKKYLAPVVPVNVFCIGLNYREHAAETGADIPDHPVIFMKSTTAVQNPDDPVRIPACCTKGPELDYEAELAVVIGRTARNVRREDALAHVLGYTIGNDISARRWQKHGGGGQWVRGKSFDTFLPLGPAVVTIDEVPDVQNLTIRSLLNGKVMQESNTCRMMRSVADLISDISRDMTLPPRTVLMTGTPPGVGFVRNPPVFLMPGDEIVVEIERIGRIRNPVLPASQSVP